MNCLLVSVTQNAFSKVIVNVWTPFTLNRANLVDAEFIDCQKGLSLLQKFSVMLKISLLLNLAAHIKVINKILTYFKIEKRHILHLSAALISIMLQFLTKFMSYTLLLMPILPQPSLYDQFP